MRFAVVFGCLMACLAAFAQGGFWMGISVVLSFALWIFIFCFLLPAILLMIRRRSELIDVEIELSFGCRNMFRRSSGFDKRYGRRVSFVRTMNADAAELHSRAAGARYVGNHVVRDEQSMVPVPREGRLAALLGSNSQGATGNIVIERYPDASHLGMYREVFDIVEKDDSAKRKSNGEFRQLVKWYTQTVCNPSPMDWVLVRLCQFPTSQLQVDVDGETLRGADALAVMERV